MKEVDTKKSQKMNRILGYYKISQQKFIFLYDINMSKTSSLTFDNISMEKLIFHCSKYSIKY